MLRVEIELQLPSMRALNSGDSSWKFFEPDFSEVSYTVDGCYGELIISEKSLTICFTPDECDFFWLVGWW